MIERRSNVMVLILSAALALLAAIDAPLTARAADVFIWTDDKGTTHFSDSTSDVPARFRKSIKTKKFGPVEEDSAAKPPAANELPDVDDAPPSPDPAPTVEETLRRFEVPYQAYEGSAKRVIVNVKFNDRVTAPMALDTGAPSSLISPNLAKELDLFDDEHGRLWVAVGGLGGSTLAIRTVVNSVQIGGARTDFVPVEVTKSISNAFEGLIGMDFMGNYAMRVDPTRRVVIFEELPQTSDRPGGRDEDWWRSTFREFAAFHNGWKDALKTVETEIDRPSGMTSTSAADLQKRREIAKRQTQEAEKLMDRLHRFARENAVPMHWRTY
ncbi:MAG: aspartyl protease family protein [Nitrospirota bacterium]